MGLTYEQSLKAAATTNNVASNMDNSMSVMSFRSPMMVSEDWVAITDMGYRFYNNEYSDTNYSSVDELKNISRTKFAVHTIPNAEIL